MTNERGQYSLSKWTRSRKHHRQQIKDFTNLWSISLLERWREESSLILGLGRRENSRFLFCCSQLFLLVLTIDQSHRTFLIVFHLLANERDRERATSCVSYCSSSGKLEDDWSGTDQRDRRRLLDSFWIEIGKGIVINSVSSQEIIRYTQQKIFLHSENRMIREAHAEYYLLRIWMNDGLHRAFWQNKQSRRETFSTHIGAFKTYSNQPIERECRQTSSSDWRRWRWSIIAIYPSSWFDFHVVDLCS